MPVEDQLPPSVVSSGIKKRNPKTGKLEDYTHVYDDENKPWYELDVKLTVSLGSYGVAQLDLSYCTELQKKNLFNEHPELILLTPPQEEVPILPIKWTISRILEVIITLFAITIFLVVWVEKYDVDGFMTYTAYLTNWTWSTLCVYFCLRMICYFDKSGTLLHYFDYIFVWPVQALVWAVMFLVIVILYYAPSLMTGMFIKYDAGTVIVGERLFHVITFVVFEVCLFLNSTEHRIMLHRKLASWFRFFIYVFLVSHAYILVYYLNNDLQYVYNLHHRISTEAIFALYELFAMFFGTFLFMLVLSPLNNLPIFAYVFWNKNTCLYVFNAGDLNHPAKRVEVEYSNKASVK